MKLALALSLALPLCYLAGRAVRYGFERLGVWERSDSTGKIR